MFIKTLKLYKKNEIIREVEFRKGLNLIVDETPSSDKRVTGNNVGKTTVLKLIDYCLGAKANIIYTDPEDTKSTYNLVKDYLKNEEVKVELILVENLDDIKSRELVIERNFLSGKKNIRKIDGKQITDKDFENELLMKIFEKKELEKPTFRQIISHNIRYKDISINNTLKTVNKYTSDVEYEALYLYLLGCTFNDGAEKQVLLAKKKQEESFKMRLEKKQTKNAYEIALNIVEDDIKVLNSKKSKMNLNEEFESNLTELNEVKYELNKCSSAITKMKIRENLIEEASKDMSKNIAEIEVNQLKQLYYEVNKNISGIQKTFEELLIYHNKMIDEKIRFISEELPELKQTILDEENKITQLRRSERELAEKISNSDSFEDLEKIISELNEKYRLKGEYENIISQINGVEENLDDLNTQINKIDDYLFSDDFKEIIKKQIGKFNKQFSSISDELYNEKYALKYDEIENKKKQKLYKFSAFNANMSSGKKQGEILCFDLAYILFAEEDGIRCLHFLLNDKKELMHDNQLVKISEFVEEKGVQLVISILKDKLPKELNNDKNIVVKLSQEEKLLRIEDNKKN